MKNEELINDAFNNGINDSNRKDVNIAVEKILMELAVQVMKMIYIINYMIKKIII